MPSTHTIPNSVTVQQVETIGRRIVHCAIVRRNGVLLACYPAEWPVNRLHHGAPTWQTSGRIPTIAEVQADARWQVK